MNTSFRVPLTTANARKLVHAASISKTTIDPRIKEIAEADLLTLDDVKIHVTDEMQQYVKPENLDWYQLARDFDYRGGFLNKNPVKVLTQLLIASRMSGRQALLVVSNNYDPAIHLASQVSGYLGLTYGMYSGDGSPDHLFGKDLLIVNSSGISDLVKTQRHRVCIVMTNIGHNGQSSHVTGMQKYLGYEFKQMLIGGHFGFLSKDTTINGYVFESLVSCLQIERVSQMFDMSFRSSVDCREYGFDKTMGIGAIAEMFGIYARNMTSDVAEESDQYDFESALDINPVDDSQF